jgi:hypothetical protein
MTVDWDHFTPWRVAFLAGIILAVPAWVAVARLPA